MSWKCFRAEGCWYGVGRRYFQKELKQQRKKQTLARHLLETEEMSLISAGIIIVFIRNTGGILKL